MSATDKINVQGLCAWYGQQAALSGIELDIRSDQVTAVIGPSGSGKSTLIRCLNRMHELVGDARMQGKVLLDGRDIYAPQVDPASVRRRVGMVFRKPNTFPSMSIEDNVLSGLRLTKTAAEPSAVEVVEHSLRAVALWEEVRDKLGSPGLQLSRGQQQRLCIARALAVKPEVLLMDDPCSSLDSIASTRIEDLLHTLRTDHTIVIVTQSIRQAARVSQRTAFLLEGELVECSDTDALFTSPRDPRTEDYITGKFG